MTLLLCLAYVIIFFALARGFKEREGYYSTVTVFGIAAFVYYLAIPLELNLFNESSYFLEGQVIPLTQWNQELIALMGILALISFAAGLRLSKFSTADDTSPALLTASASAPVPASAPLLSRPSAPVYVPKIQTMSTPAFSLVMAAVSFLILALFFWDQIPEYATYELSYQSHYSSPLFNVISVYTIISLCLTAALLCMRDRPRIILASCCTLPPIIWGFYSSDKDPILLAFLALGAILTGRRSRHWMTLGLLLTGALLGLLGLPLFSKYRGGISMGAALQDYNLTLTRSDPAGPLASLSDTITTNPPRRLGLTYLNNFTLMVPKALWANRPLDLSEEYARDRIWTWLPGQGVGYSLLTEAYLNFGTIGAVIQYFLIGWFWGIGWTALKRLLVRWNTTLWHPFYYILGYYLLIIMHRGPTGQITKTIIHFSAILIAFVWLKSLHIPRPKLAKLKGAPARNSP